MVKINSEVDICNLALGHLKINRISNIDNPSTNSERICALNYTITRQSVLESDQWAFASKRVALASDVNSPAFGWDKQSAELPSDFLKLIGIYDSNSNIYVNTNNKYYDFENNRILTNLTAPYNIKYTADISDVSKFDKLFIMNLSYALAVSMSEAFDVSSTTLQILNLKWQEWSNKALAVNGHHTGIIRINESEYINSRSV